MRLISMRLLYCLSFVLFTTISFAQSVTFTTDREEVKIHCSHCYDRNQGAAPSGAAPAETDYRAQVDGGEIMYAGYDREGYYYQINVTSGSGNLSMTDVGRRFNARLQGLTNFDVTNKEGLEELDLGANKILPKDLPKDFDFCSEDVYDYAVVGTVDAVVGTVEPSCIVYNYSPQLGFTPGKKEFNQGEVIDLSPIVGDLEFEATVIPYFRYLGTRSVAYSIDDFFSVVGTKIYIKSIPEDLYKYVDCLKFKIDLKFSKFKDLQSYFIAERLDVSRTKSSSRSYVSRSNFTSVPLCVLKPTYGTINLVTAKPKGDWVYITTDSETDMLQVKQGENTQTIYPMNSSSRSMNNVTYNNFRYRVYQPEADVSGINTYFGVSGQRITCLIAKGAPRLRHLVAGTNEMEHLNVFDNKLETLDASQNNLHTIALSHTLEDVDVSGNQLEDLDIRLLSKLINLNANYNQLKMVQMANNSLTKNISLYNNQLTAIDLSQAHSLQKLVISQNKLTSLDLSKQKRLQFLYAQSNMISNLVWSPSKSLQAFYVNTNDLAINQLRIADEYRYGYSGQQRPAVPKKVCDGDMIDLSNYATAENSSVESKFIWVTSVGDTLVLGDDYEQTDSGKFTFKGEDPANIYAVISREDLPQLRTKFLDKEDNTIKLDENFRTETIKYCGGIGDDDDDTKDDDDGKDDDTEDEMDKPSILQVFPNPGKNYVRITKDKCEDCKAAIHDSNTGLVVKSAKFSDYTQIFTHSLSAGSYIIKVTDKKGMTTQKSWQKID